MCTRTSVWRSRVLANRGDVNTFDLAEQVAELYLAGSATVADRRTTGLPPGAMFITDEHFAGAGIPVLDPALDAEQLAGRYDLEDDRELIVEYSGGRLLLKLRDDIPRVPLALQPSGRSLRRVEFLRDDEGAVTGLRAEAYAWGATAEFRRVGGEYPERRGANCSRHAATARECNGASRRPGRRPRPGARPRALRRS